MNREIMESLKESLDTVIQNAQEGRPEFWYARDLQSILGYDRWENFAKVIQKAVQACDGASAPERTIFVTSRKWFSLEGCMDKNQLDKVHFDTFESIRQVSDDGQEFWMARALAKILDYAEYRNFLPVIEKAKTSCANSGQQIGDHFVEMHEMVVIGSEAIRKITSYALSRYACYLIVQNGDPTKLVIASGQTYFALQTRRQELANDDQFQQLKEEEKRLFLRNELREHSKLLVETAQGAGVATNLDFAIFQNHGYKGLYGGLDAKAIHAGKKLKKSQHILDHMGSTELAANLFRATQTEEKLRRDKVQGKSQANQTPFEVGRKVRKTIEELGGTMPETLPTPKDSIKKIPSKSTQEANE